MELISVLIGGLGLGSLLTALLNHLVSRRAVVTDRRYQEKQEAYLGLLNALHQAAVKPSDENSKAYALWQVRCELFGSAAVAKYAQRMTETNDAPRDERNAVYASLIQSNA